eukprot:TRINITY_DN821_c0_g1_i6.p2 TRINITY_DN821_c0_g1~~TRINITY_DN821_c0_g1_i6.p2  ORF type:complete len:186 (+),score=43.17 TRINITY_DN821_c0_g1_i6:207-764(+)
MPLFVTMTSMMYGMSRPLMRSLRASQHLRGVCDMSGSVEKANQDKSPATEEVHVNTSSPTSASISTGKETSSSSTTIHQLSTNTSAVEDITDPTTKVSSLDATETTSAQQDQRDDAKDQLTLESVGDVQDSKSLKRPRPPTPVEPTRPEPDECCGNGCSVCVWDLYDKACEEYRRNSHRRICRDW